MLTYSFRVGRSPSAWLLAVTFAACGSSDLDAWSQFRADSGAVGDLVATGGGGGVMSSDVADDPEGTTGEAADTPAPQPGDPSSQPRDDDMSGPGHLGTRCDGGACDATQPCVAHLGPSTSPCEARCGNGRIDADEDCEIGLPGWTSSNCSASCRQTLYPNSNQCTFEIGVDPFTIYGQGNCPDLPGFSEACFYLFGQHCQLLCNSTADCPIGFTCNPTLNPRALGPGWCAKL